MVAQGKTRRYTYWLEVSLISPRIEPAIWKRNHPRKNKKPSSELRASVPIDITIGFGSDGFGYRSGHRCVVWIPYHKTYGLLISQLIEVTRLPDLQADEYVAQARD